MSLVINNVHGQGKTKEEYVLLYASADCDIGDYVVADNTYDPKGVLSNESRHTFWFPPKKIKKNEYVSLRTGKGKNTTSALASGEVLHRFYWGLETPVWNDTGDAITLLKISDRTTRKVIA